MGTSTLFGDSEEIARPRTLPPEAVVRELIELGVSEQLAHGYENRQAHAVLKKLRERESKAGSGSGTRDDPLPAGRGEASMPERHTAANDLEEMLRDEMRDPYERLCMRLILCLYPLTRAEFVNVVKCVISQLRSA